MSSKKPQPAQVEDYDSDAGRVKAGSKVEARRKPTASRPPPKSIDRYRTNTKDAASDSGYSSHTSGTQASAGSASATAHPAPTPARQQKQPSSQTKMKPVIHRIDTQQAQPSSRTRSSSSSRPSKQQATPCDDLHCRHPHCLTVRYPEYAKTPQSPATYTTQYTQNPMAYQHVQPPYSYQYAQVPQAAPQVPQALSPAPTLPEARRRSSSASQQQRPVSIHGYSYPSIHAVQQGPPPSHSAYHNAQYTAMVQPYRQSYGHSQSTVYPNGSTSMQPFSAYSTTPVPSSPTAQRFGSSLQRTYSARASTPSVAGYEMPHRTQPQQIPARPLSARYPTYRIPGSFPDEGPRYSDEESESETGSSSEYSEDEYVDRRPVRRDSRPAQMSGSTSLLRRPPIPERHRTTPVIQPSPKRETLRRARQSESRIGHLSSSDNMDSDRTARAVVDRRTTYTGSSRSSRRPSVSSTTGSGRTRDTGLTSASGSRVVIEDRHGRRSAYLSKEARDDLIRRYQEQEREEQQNLYEKVAAYQDLVNGHQVPELTAENIRKQERRASGSHLSAHSHSKSSNSASKSQKDSKGVKMQYGDTVLYIHGEAKIELRPGEDGEDQILIGNHSGRDSAYHSSHQSAGTRQGRSRGSSNGRRRRDTIVEDGYESAH